jgi:putative sigma-54 modulation protein
MQIDIHARHIANTPSLDELARRRLAYALGRFSTRIKRVVLRLDDVNGPKGGEDIAVVAEVELVPTGNVVVKGSYPNAEHAICTTAERLRHCLLRQSGRSRSQRKDVSFAN